MLREQLTMKQFMVIAMQKSAEGIVPGVVPGKARTNLVYPSGKCPSTVSVSEHGLASMYAEMNEGWENRHR